MVSTKASKIHPPDYSSTIPGTYLIYLTIHQGRQSFFFFFSISFLRNKETRCSYHFGVITGTAPDKVSRISTNQLQITLSLFLLEPFQRDPAVKH